MAPGLPRLNRAEASGQRVAALIREHGCVVVESLVERERMVKLASDLALVRGTFSGEKSSFAGAHTIRNAAKPLGESVVAQELATCPVVVGAVNSVLGAYCRRVVLGTCSAIDVVGPAAGEISSPAQALHRDDTMWPAQGEKCVTVMWAVTDFTATNGATRVVPGSHRWPRLEHDDDEPEDLAAQADSDVEDDDIESVVAEMPAGSALLFCGSTLHGASKFHHGHHRLGLLFIYNLGWLRPEHNFHWAIPQAIMDTFSLELKALLGMIGENRAKHEWYIGPVYAQPILGLQSILSSKSRIADYRLAAYARIWACASLLEISKFWRPPPFFDACLSPLITALLYVVWRPQSRAGFGTALLLRIVSIVLCNETADGLWAMLIDVAVLIAVLTVEDARPTVKWQLFVFYAANAFWKWNSAFLADSKLTPFLSWMNEGHWQRTLAQIAPWAKLLVEHVPLLLFVEPALGLVAIMALHLGHSALCGAAMIPRLFCFAHPDALDIACSEAATRAYAVAATAIAAYLNMESHAFVAAVSVFYCRAAYMDRFPRKSTRRLPVWHWLLVLAAVMYAWLLPILSILNDSNILSQLKLPDGSNHMLLPTALLQRRWNAECSETETLSGGGGVRIELAHMS